LVFSRANALEPCPNFVTVWARYGLPPLYISWLELHARNVTPAGVQAFTFHGHREWKLCFTSRARPE
jgi:hypothetical protein